MTSDLELVSEAVTVTLDYVRQYGGLRVETGGFFCAPRAAPDIITVVALTGTDGITRQRNLFMTSGSALEQLFTWADERELRIRAQFHSHGGRAFLSATDLKHGLNVRGFTTCVIPRFTDPPSAPDNWGWWRFDGERWMKIGAPTVVTGELTRVVTFDEASVR